MSKRYFIPLLLVLILLTGCVKPQNAQSPASDLPALRLSCQEDGENLQGTQFSSDDLGSNFKNGLAYHHVKGVTIEAEGNALPLETALKDGTVTEEDIFYYARKDARAGFCQEVTDSRLGVSGYTYHYPDFSLSLTYDIYELPDGTQEPISRCDVFLPVVDGTEYRYGPYTSFPDEETGLYNDREDWGVAFTVTEAAPTGITVKCAQADGQQIGLLTVTGYSLSSKEGALALLEEDLYLPSYEFTISPNQESEFAIDWTAAYGPLESGEYTLMLQIQDVFAPEEVHPLMKDYHDRQEYGIPFTVE